MLYVVVGSPVALKSCVIQASDEMIMFQRSSSSSEESSKLQALAGFALWSVMSPRVEELELG